MNGEPIRILLVESDPEDARLVSEMLAEVTTAQFNLTRTERLDESLKRLGEEAFDVVLLNLSLPDSQGLDTFARAHTAEPDVAIVVLTSPDNDKTRAIKAIQGGAQDYLFKGQVDGHLLARVMQYAIERQRMWVKLQQYAQQLQARLAQRSQTIEEADTNGEPPKKPDSPEALIEITERCLNPDAKLAKNSQQLIQSLEYPLFVRLLGSILESVDTRSNGRKLFQILYRLRNRDLLKYILSFHETHPENSPEKKVLMHWLGELGIMRQYVETILNLPGVDGLNPSTTAIASCAAPCRILDDQCRGNASCFIGAQPTQKESP